MNYQKYIERLFKSHYEQMFRWALALLHDGDTARDVVHDVFASLLDSQSEIRVTSGYLLKAVKNRCLNHIRNCDIRQRIVSRYLLEYEDYDSGNWPDEETIERIEKIIENELSPRARQILELRFSEGIQFSRIAETLGISETAVYRHLSRAILLIRQNLTL